MDLEFRASEYFWFWGNLSVSFLKLGFIALDKTDLSNSIPPTVMSLFSYSLTIFIFHSSNYALITHPLLHKPTLTYTVPVLIGNILLLFSLSSVPVGTWKWTVLYITIICVPIVYLAFKSYPNIRKLFLGTSNPFQDYLWRIQFPGTFTPCLQIMASFFSSKYSLSKSIEESGKTIEVAPKSSSSYILDSKDNLSLALAVFIPVLTSVSWASISRDEGAIKTILKSKIHPALRNNKKKVKFVKFMIGMLGTVLFQCFFRLTSWDHVMAFLCFTVSWLGTLALLPVSNDFGVFDFLLGNVVVGCTVSQFGLGGATWYVYAAALVLYGLRLLVETASAVDKGGDLVVRLEMQPSPLSVVKYLWGASRNDKSQMGSGSFEAIVYNHTQDMESVQGVRNERQDIESTTYIRGEHQSGAA